MSRQTTIVLIGIFAAVLFLCPNNRTQSQSSMSASSPHFAITQIAPRERRFDQPSAVAINTAGDVVCVSYPTEPVSDLQPFLWEDGHVVSPVDIQPYSMNNHGQIVGVEYYTEGHPPSRNLSVSPAIWQNRKMYELGTVGIADSINDSGQVVGTLMFSTKSSRGFLWQDGKTKDLGVLHGCTTSRAEAINNSGEIVGECSYTTKLGKYAKTMLYPCVWKSGHWERIASLAGQNQTSDNIDDLYKLPGVFHSNYAINNRGDILIHWDTWNVKGGYSLGKTYLWLNNRLTKVAGMVSAYALNDRDDIVGQVRTHGGGLDAALWRNGKLIDLNSTLADGSGWTLKDARSINDRGDIVGDGKYKGRISAFLLRPEGS